MTTKIAPPCLFELPCPNITSLKIGWHDELWICQINNKPCELQSSSICATLDSIRADEEWERLMADVDEAFTATDNLALGADGCIDDFGILGENL